MSTTALYRFSRHGCSSNKTTPKAKARGDTVKRCTPDRSPIRPCYSDGGRARSGRPRGLSVGSQSANCRSQAVFCPAGGGELQCRRPGRYDPGVSRLSWSGSGLAIRTGGALALFVLTFVYTPDVLADQSTQTTISAPGGVASQSITTSPITINPPPSGQTPPK